MDWRRYEQAESRLEEVRHEIYGIPNLNQDPLTRDWIKFPHGMRLILDGLKDEWTIESLAELRAELSLLVSPFSALNDFRIELELTGYLADDVARWRCIIAAVCFGSCKLESRSDAR